MNHHLDLLSNWSINNSLAANSIKTKFIICSSTRLSKLHNIDTHRSNVIFNDLPINREKSVKLLGVSIDEHLTWDEYLNSVISSCYASLSALRKLKNFTTQKLRKQLVEALIFSKIDYNDFVYTLTTSQQKKLQRLQLAACSFVYKRYCNINDILKLKGLLIKDRRDFHLLKITHKALYDSTWPSICQLEIKIPTRTLRNSQDTRLKPSNNTGCFQDCASKLFNTLPTKLRCESSYKVFSTELKAFLLDSATARHTAIY